MRTHTPSILTRRISWSTSPFCTLFPRAIINVRCRKSFEARNIEFWRDWFIVRTDGLQESDCIMLLVYVAFRAHLFIPVIEKLAETFLITYKMPSHLTTIPYTLDLGAYPSFSLQVLILIDNAFQPRRMVFARIDQLGSSWRIALTYGRVFMLFEVNVVSIISGIVQIDEVKHLARLGHLVLKICAVLPLSWRCSKVLIQSTNAGQEW